MPPFVWLITGCSSGFGSSLSLIALKAGHKVIATSRNPSKTPELVKQFENLGGTWLQLDVNAPNVTQTIQEAVNIFGYIDIIVNNAGIAILGALEDMTDDECRKQFETNFFAPLTLIRAVLPFMRERRSGTIVNVSSSAALGARPSMGVYGASKSALEGLSLTLAEEVAQFNIRVLIVQPGAFTTNMMNAVVPNQHGVSKAYRDAAAEKTLAYFTSEDEELRWTAGGDVDKGSQAMFDVITGTGAGIGKEQHVRLPLSQDVAQKTQRLIDSLQTSYEAFRDIWENTGHDGGAKKRFPKPN